MNNSTEKRLENLGIYYDLRSEYHEAKKKLRQEKINLLKTLCRDMNLKLTDSMEGRA